MAGSRPKLPNFELERGERVWLNLRPLNATGW
jgi:hypothetical protein